MDAAWSLTARKGFLTLKTPGLAPNLFQARNTLTQRMVGPECTGVVKLDVSYSTDGKTWSKPSPHVPLRFDTGKFFMGSRFAIFNYATKTPGGSVAVDYFRTRATEHG